ncbi:MAG TPA: RnfABCDGE type electron transport complex subunit D [Phycisphaerae bacterium]|nr:RnfABCDGE type electron transport complex subunit D [Phycisphaerae bacterium]
MKLLLGMMDRLRPAFRKGPLRLLYPAFEAIDTFLFSVGERTDTAPHVRGPDNLKRYMTAVILAVMPCILAGIYLFGWRVAAMIVVTYVTGLSIELLFAVLRKEEINEGFFVTGLLYPLILPPGLPLWMVAVGIAFGVVVGKELFGGTGRNPFNPALVARCFLLIGYPTAMSTGWSVPAVGGAAGFARYSIDTVSAATPLSAAKQGQFADMWSLFVGNCSGSAGETSSLLILLGGVFLVVCGVANWRTLVATLGSFAVLLGALVWLVPESFGRAGWNVSEVVGWHILAGGLLFGTVFMATDPVSSPFSNLGKWLYGIVIGVSTVLIRTLTGYVEGVMFAILLGNIAAPIFDEIATHMYVRRLRNEG